MPGRVSADTRASLPSVQRQRWGFPLFLYKELVELKCDDILVETLGFDDGQLFPAFTKEPSSKELCKISRSPCHDNLTEMPYLLGTYSFGMVLHPRQLIQDASRTMKLFFTQLYNVRRFRSFGSILNTCYYVWWSYSCLPNLLSGSFRLFPWIKKNRFVFSL